MYKIGALFFLFYLMSGTSVFSQKKDWKLIKEEEGIKVYSRPSSHENAPKELKVTTELHSSLAAVVSIIADKASFPKWVYGCGASELLKEISPGETYHYQVTNMPWPIQSRDIIIYTLITQEVETNIVRLDSKGVPDYIPHKEEYIRVGSYKADWKFTPKGNGIIDLEYFMKVDPGGSIPNWVINMVAAEGPMKTVKNLRNTLPQHQNVKLSYIKN